MSGLNWKPFVYGGLASIVAEFGKNVEADMSAPLGYRYGNVIFWLKVEKKKLAVFVLKTVVSYINMDHPETNTIL